ncbi:MAG: cytochrome P450 [Xenococcaceae cyanobacterium MO_207.B15]|nr:cytochrome P450 [Xenococcaceae cyanobacterium MO_207.B15]
MTAKIPPKAKEIPLLGSLISLLKNPLNYLREISANHVGIVHFTVPNSNLYLVLQPDIVREVLVDKVAEFPKAKQEVAILGRNLGEGLIAVNGAKHKQQRKLSQPAFHAKRIETYAQTIIDYAAEMIQDWKAEDVRDLSEEMYQLTLYIVSKTLLGADKSEMMSSAKSVAVAIKTIQEVTDSDYDNPLLNLFSWIREHPSQRGKQARAVLDETILKLVAKRRSITDSSGQMQDKGDLLSMLLLAKDEDNSHLSDDEVLGMLLNLFIAGHETTSNALTWTWYLLSLHREVEDKFQAEIDTVLGERLPTVADLKQLNYTQMIVKESLRLFPPVWALSAREAIKDTNIGGYFIPKGGQIWIVPYVLHHRPKLFDSPEKFDPERFDPARVEEIPRYAYIPFGAGNRICIGNSFAMMEATLILATVARKFRFELMPEQVVVPNPQITMSSKYGMRMCLKARNNSDRTSVK